MMAVLLVLLCLFVSAGAVAIDIFSNYYKYVDLKKSDKDSDHKKANFDMADSIVRSFCYLLFAFLISGIIIIFKFLF